MYKSIERFPVTVERHRMRFGIASFAAVCKFGSFKLI